ncbi:hypothetical protein AVEN_90173-1 [Araneus ventricosus]|uniref:Uncharacterized protein n=1 Tax=Araneus ventricosus TaxID=182803 RepID=A0A4Y2STG3_ARAVE|nr:hypothetical protein AVEN_90173-1 [Araneus ventricosus]
MKLSYAEAAKLNNKRKKPTLLLYPSEETDKEIEEILTEELKVDSANFRFKNVRKIQNKGLAIVWDKHQQLEKLRETILSNNILKKNISLRLPGKRYPSLIIYDLPNDTTNEDVQIALKAYSNWGEDLRLRFKMRGRKEGTSHWVLEAPREAFFNLRRLRKIPIK